MKTVELEANVAIDVIKIDSMASGTGQAVYIAQDNKYKYTTSIPVNLQNESLMRNTEVLFTGSKFYFFDRESNIVSFQSSKEVRLPSSLPNPFFLPLEFLSNDDDGCEGCKMRLQDFKAAIRWPKRVSSISEISSETTNGIINSVIEMPGGTLNSIPYKYRIRLVGESITTLQPISVSRVKEDGTPLVEILLSDLRVVQGINVKVPHVIEVGARDETGRLVLRAVFTTTKLKLNQQIAAELLAPNFVGAESFWNSDSKSFVQQ